MNRYEVIIMDSRGNRRSVSWYARSFGEAETKTLFHKDILNIDERIIQIRMDY